jgi:nitrous oxidase accessory protein NosD
MSALSLYRRWLAAAILAAGLALLTAVPVAQAATSPCRVRNLTQDTYGRSLIRMVERAKDGDRLRVRGTCRGEVIVRHDITIRGMGPSPTLTGRGETRVVRVKRGAEVTLRGLTIEHGRIGRFAYGGAAS